MPTATLAHLQESIFMSTNKMQKLFALSFSHKFVLDQDSKNT